MGTVNNWKSHGQYVSCVRKTSRNFMKDGLISKTEFDVNVADAKASSCGN